MLKTRLTELLGLEYPIVSAPMARISGGQLAAAISDAGALGTFGGVHPNRPIDTAYLREHIRHVRAQTDRRFGVGFITHLLQRDPQNFEIVLEEHVPVILFSFADPHPWLGRAKASGAITICQVQSLDAARRAVDRGADVLAVQGNEAGGHTGPQNLLPFLVQTIETFPQVPIIAAGGIANGRSLAAVLAAGADGAWLGTVFLTVAEANETSAIAKECILHSDGQDTIYTKVFDLINQAISQSPLWPEGIAYRARRNQFVEQWHGREDEMRANLNTLIPTYSQARQHGDLSIAPVPYGESSGFIKQIRPAAEVIAAICDEAEHYLRQGVNRIVD